MVCICLRFIILVTVPSFGNAITFRYVHKYVQLLTFGYVSEAVILHQSGGHSQVIYKQLCSWGKDSCIQNIHSISISTINVINHLVQTDKDIAQDFHHLYIVYHYNQTKRVSISDVAYDFIRCQRLQDSKLVFQQLYIHC